MILWLYINVFPTDWLYNNIKEYFEFVEKCFNKIFTFSKLVIWATKTKINIYRLDMKFKVGAGPIQGITGNDPSRTTIPVKHGCENLAAWTSSAASGVSSMVFIDNVNNDRKVS